MNGEYEQLIRDLGGEILSPGDPRRPQHVRKVPDTVGLVPTGSTIEPQLVVHLASIFPWQTPDVFLPPDRAGDMARPHVNYTGLVCSRGYRVFANPSKPKEVLEQVIREAVDVLEHEYTDKDRDAQLIEEASAYWSHDAQNGFHYLPGHLDKNFLFQCRTRSLPVTNATLFETEDLSSRATIAGIRHDVPAEEIFYFLSNPEEWWRKSETTKDCLLKAITTLQRLNTKSIKAILCFRIRSKGEDIILPALLSREIKLRKLGHDSDTWVDTVQNGQRFERLACQNMGSRRLVRRAIGKAQADSSTMLAIYEARLAMIGCGALGSHIIDLLSKSGIQNLYLIDNDKLMPENLARHTLSGEYCYIQKICGIKSRIKDSFPETAIQGQIADIRDSQAQAHLMNWSPSLIISATGDLSPEMALSDLCRCEKWPCWFCRVEPKMAAGHLIFQSASAPTTLDALYESIGGELFYKFRVAPDGDPIDEKELGCQTAFTPFSGVDAALFSALCAREILKHIETPLDGLTAFRWKPEFATLERVHG
jgi:hypothetical protein